MAKREITNPAVGLFNTGDRTPQPQAEPHQTDAAAPAQQPGDLTAQEKQEPRTQRKQILLQPYLHRRAEAKCRRLNISMNEVINQLLKSWVEQ
jgi:hypothetical protein